MTLEGIAWKIAEKAFEGKVDKGGLPYIRHMQRIVSYLAPKFRGERDIVDVELISIAILHDLIEDCPEWTLDLLSAIFTERIIAGIDAMTKRKNESYELYIERLSLNDDAVMIKLCDLKDNMDITRLPGLTQKDTERLNKYLWAWRFLSEKAGQTFKIEFVS